MTDNNKEVSVTYGEQIRYIQITFKELIVMMWEYMRNRRFQQKNDTFPQ